MEVATVSLIALAVLVLMLTFGIPLSFRFGAALMTMYHLADATMEGSMIWGYSQLGVCRTDHFKALRIA